MGTVNMYACLPSTQPGSITNMLGVSPTVSERKGNKKKRALTVLTQGILLISATGNEPLELQLTLSMFLPKDTSIQSRQGSMGTH